MKPDLESCQPVGLMSQVTHFSVIFKRGDVWTFISKSDFSRMRICIQRYLFTFFKIQVEVPKLTYL